MDNTDPICTRSISGEKNPGQDVTVSLTCNDPDGELKSIGDAEATHNGLGLLTDSYSPPDGGSLPSPYTVTRTYSEGQYAILCFNKAGGSCIVTAEVVEATCDKCEYKCCPEGSSEENGKCRVWYGNVSGGPDYVSHTTCHKRCQSASYCGYIVK